MIFKKTLIATAMIAALGGCSDDDDPAASDKNFNRVASYAVCKLIDTDCNTDTETAAEIVAATSDGMTLVFSDSPQSRIGFVDITTPSAPSGIGTTDMGGEPTSVAVKGDYALVGVNTSSFGEDPAGPADPDDEDGDLIASGSLKVVDIATRSVVRTIDVGGQPDSVAVSPDGNYAAIAIENERNEDHFTLGDNIGTNPQLPTGKLVVIDTSDADPANWSASDVDLTTLITAGVAPTDLEPEYVDINSNNIAVVTMQENNHIALVDLSDGSVSADFTAGTVDLDLIDATEEDPAIIDQSESQTAIPREPDGVTWIGTSHFATADEGDMDGGSRGFTIFDTAGNVAYTAGNKLDHMTARFGHYPDGRSGNKGNEPENAEVGTFGDDTFLFVNSERSSLVFVYNVNDPASPVYKQTLPASAGPEGALAIPSRNLLVVASEEDNRGDKIRGTLNIYQYAEGAASYPTIQSVDRANGTPIPWSAMSGLSADPTDTSALYAVEDSFYGSNRIFKLDTSKTPVELNQEIKIMDSNDVFAGFTTSGSTEDPDSFDDVDLAAMINADKSVNLDPEGIAARLDGNGFWVASEGAGTVYETGSRPIEKLNLIFKTDTSGVIEQVITLPTAINAKQVIDLLRWQRIDLERVLLFDAKGELIHVLH
jgi:hypothetical protein